VRKSKYSHRAVVIIGVLLTGKGFRSWALTNGVFMKHLIILGIVIISAGSMSATVQAELSSEAQNVVDRCINYFSSSWKQSVSMNMDVEIAVSGNAAGTMPMIYKHQYVFKRDQDRMKITEETKVTDEQGELVPNGTVSLQYVADGDRYIQAEYFNSRDRYLVSTRKNAKPLVKLKSTSTEVGNFVDGKLDKIRSLEEWIKGDQSVRVLDSKEKVNGVKCHVVEADMPDGKLTAWIDPDRGYGAIKYVLRISGNYLFENGKRFRDGDPGVEELEIAVDSIEIDKFGDTFIPTSGKCTKTYTYSDGTQKITKMKVDRSNIELSPDFNDPNTFRVNLPDGITVYDEDVPGVRYEWRNGGIVKQVDKELVETITSTMHKEKEERSKETDQSVEDQEQIEKTIASKGKNSSKHISAQGNGAIWIWIVVVFVILGIAGVVAASRFRKKSVND